ncbi:hypothetical protein BTO20_25525 [Mycobacterium dioxanotrophicus]|jgi:hypothetical protein|uniref:Integral membrane protein n=1 Tax=Mycobacterium dioxanotrophicus TaxID=482462 RepID=A0A1Y0C887_9MYCO|nr:hypothetical protein [Mycobacterium dioxanotrophicus]ART71458.1 hypothetical protein BTO20_25525 [Mycobacterium dioxanotrophicus]
MTQPPLQPPIVRYAGYLVAAEGVLGLIAAVVLVVRGLAGADQHIVSGYGTALWFVLVGGGVLAGGWALITGRRWGRGIGVFANLLLLGVAWYVFTSHQVGYGIAVGVLALVTLGMLLSPSAVHWSSGRR